MRVKITNNFYSVKLVIIIPNTGTDRIRIYSQLYQTFIINVDLKNVSKETLVRKVATHTGLPSSNIKLYKQ